LATQRRRIGPVEREVRKDIRALVTEHPMGEALAAMSLNLARTLDEGAGLATAAVNRELRANLLELSRLAVDDNDELDAELSAAVRDDARSGPGDAGSGDGDGGGPAR
jgi:hypothetical protein